MVVCVMFNIFVLFGVGVIGLFVIVGVSYV